MKKNIIKIFLLVILLITSGCIDKNNEIVKQKELVTLDKLISDLTNYNKVNSRAVVAEIIMPGIYVKDGVIYEYYSITKLEIMSFEERAKLYNNIEEAPSDIYVVLQDKIMNFLMYSSVEDLITNGGDASDGIGICTEIYNVENGKIVCSDGNTLKSISVETAPLKLNYSIGETAIDLSGIVVTGTYVDGTVKIEAITAENISGFDTSTDGLKNIVVDISGRKSVFVIRVNEKVLNSISVETAPTKTSYYVGDSTLSLSGLVVTGVYNNGTSSAQTITSSNISGFSTTTSGTKTITVTVSGKTATFPITVVDVVLNSIAVTTQPTKTSYYVGDSTLSLSGLVVTGVYNNGTSSAQTITSSNISEFSTTTSGTKTITVTVNGKTATFPITVVDVVLNSIAIITQPTKTNYYVGDSTLSLIGLEVRGTYNNGTVKTETITSSNISGFITTTSGTKTITVTVSGKTATFPITVVDVALCSISVTIAPTKTSYYVGDSTVSLSGLVVTGTYNNGTSKSETITSSNISGFSTTTSGTKTITVTVSGKTATFPITVADAISKAAFTLTKNIDILKLKQYSAIFEVADTSIKTLVLTGNGGVSPGQISMMATSVTVAKIVMDATVTQIVVKALDVNGNQVGATKTITLN